MNPINLCFMLLVLVLDTRIDEHSDFHQIQISDWRLLGPGA